MFFVKLGKVMAYILLILSILRLFVASFVAIVSETAEQNEWLTNRYLGSGMSGEHIDRALMWLALAIVIGMLAEIGKSIHANKKLGE